MAKAKKRSAMSSLDIVKQALRTIGERSDAPYDGILGSLPSWAPPQMRHEFEVARNALLVLARDSIDVVRQGFLAQRIMYDEPNFNAGFRSTPTYPPELENDLRTIYKIWRVVQMPEDERHRHLVGEYGMQSIGKAAITKNASTAGRTPRNVERDRHIMALNSDGKATHVIVKILARDGIRISASQVRRVVAREGKK